MVAGLTVLGSLTRTREVANNWTVRDGDVGSCEFYLLLAVHEALEPGPGLVIGPLLGRRLHQIRGWRQQRALEPAVHRGLAAADGVDHDAGRVGGVPDLELQLHVDRLVAEPGALQPDVRPLAVREPRDVVAGADVDGVLGEVVGEL